MAESGPIINTADYARKSFYSRFVVRLADALTHYRRNIGSAGFYGWSIQWPRKVAESFSKCFRSDRCSAETEARFDPQPGRDREKIHGA